MAAETETNRSEERDDENQTRRIGAVFGGVSLLPGDLRGPALKGAEYSSLWVYGAHPSEESLKQAVEQNNLYLGWQGARVAAAVVLEEGPEGWALHLLAVQPAFRRQNLGSEMLTRMADLARARGGTKLLLDVVGDNLPAVRLYERPGFASTGRRQEFQNFCGHVALREYALAL